MENPWHQAPAQRLIIFTRYPHAGTTKTRLIPVLGSEGAADLQRRMTETVLDAARQARELRSLEVEICHAGGRQNDLVRWLGDDLLFRQQTKGHIGRRMAMAFEGVFRDATQHAVLIGSDIPEISAEIIHAAFQGLRENPMVLGPTRDGGYYLIGMTAAGATQLIPRIFEDIPWSTPAVYRSTLEKIKELGLGCGEMPRLTDVDRPEDLMVWERCRIPEG
jgi:rSAM/selenodomain-associated transferase 1